MSWNEQDHPRDDDGKFTFKNGGSGINTKRESLTEVLYKNSKIKKEEEIMKQKEKSKLLDILGNKATPADILYADNDKIKEKIKESELQTKTTFESPLKGRISSEFGPRKTPTKNASTNHSGIDIAVPIGTPVKTISSGTVTKAGASKGYGVAVFIDHGIINGKHVTSEYGHLSKTDVKVGDKIKAGQIVAKSGNSGYSSGPHLHITIKENNIPVNPRKYIKFD